MSEHIARWSANSWEALELSAAELAAMVSRGEPLVEDLRTDALTLSALSGASCRTLVRGRWDAMIVQVEPRPNGRGCWRLAHQTPVEDGHPWSRRRQGRSATASLSSPG